MAQIKGVNLGNWLVLEKWMSRTLFEGTTAEDEDELCRQLPEAELKARLKAHRDTYITKRDFEYIKERGMNVVRIPVPHFIFGDDPEYCKPYVPCIEYLDLAFEWAKETGLEILIDLHTAPESQNGFDNGGICGVCKCFQSEARINRLLVVLEKLAARYGSSPQLWGIEVINEPISEQMWESTRSKYPPHDPKRAEGSDFVPLSVLKKFYKDAYHVIRRHMDESKAVVMHDAFRFEAWYGFMQEPEYKNVILDAHWYLGMGSADGCDEVEYIRKIFREHVEKLESMKTTMPVVIGEWCLSHTPSTNKERTPVQKDLFYRLLADAQLSAWENCMGYFWWSYKLINGPEGWDFRNAVENGWMPSHL